LSTPQKIVEKSKIVSQEEGIPEEDEDESSSGSVEDEEGVLISDDENSD
jgi:hypothetical protein